MSTTPKESAAITNNVILPPIPAIFHGRDDLLLSAVSSILAQGDSLPNISILGPGGVGKSSLSLAILHHPQIQEFFGTRRFFIPCDAATNLTGLVGVIAQHLDISGSDLEKKIAGFYSVQRSILVLDNFESPWEGQADRDTVEGFLSSLSGIGNLSLLITMRGTERPSGTNWDESIPPLPVLTAEASRRVFQEISGRKDDDTESIDTLVRLVEYLPLAIALVSNLAISETPLSLVQRWAEKRTAMVLQQDVPSHRLSSLDMSILTSLNSPRVGHDAKDLLSLLSLLPDGLVTKEVNESVTGVPDAATALSELQRTGLCVTQPERIRVLAPIREYMKKHYPPSPTLFSSLRTYFESLALRALSLGGPDSKSIVLALAPEVGNIQAIILYTLKRADPISAVHASIAMTELRRTTGLGSTECLEACIPVAEGAHPSLHANVLYSLGRIAMFRSDYQVSDVHYAAARALFTIPDDLPVLSKCISDLAQTHLSRSQFDISTRYLDEAVDLFQQCNDIDGEARALIMYARIARMKDNDLVRATTLLHRALEMAISISNLSTQAYVQFTLGQVEFDRANFTTAKKHFSAGLALNEGMEHAFGQGISHIALGSIDTILGSLPEAEVRFERAYPLLESGGWTLLDCVYEQGQVALARGDLDRAGQKLSQSLELAHAEEDVNAEARSLLGLANLAKERGLIADARTGYENAEEMYGSPIGKARCQVALAGVLKDEAFDCISRARTIFQRLGDNRGLATCFAQLGFLVRDRAGQIILLEHALDLFAEIGMKLDQADVTLLLADLLSESGQTRTAALEMYQRAENLFEGCDVLVKRDVCVARVTALKATETRE